MDGLKPGIWIAVAIQKPKDLDTAYELALLIEELGEVPSAANQTSNKRATALPLPLPPRPRYTKEKRSSEGGRAAPMEDKWSSLRSFRKAKGLCFVCGEKWSRDHVCKSSVQLHFM